MHSRTPTILFVCNEDWFFHSHFLPLVRAARQADDNNAEIVLVTNVGDKAEALRQQGIRIIPLDFTRDSMGMTPVARQVRQLHGLLQRLRPDIVHCIALRPILIGGLASHATGVSAVIYHLTGQGFLGLSNAKRHRMLRAGILRLLLRQLRNERSWLLLENPDDRDVLRRLGDVPPDRHTILGGAGVDPHRFPALPPPENDPPRAAFVGRLIWSKGVDVLVEAIRILAERGLPVKLDLYGAPDPKNPRVIPMEKLTAWARQKHIAWHGRTDDVVGVWRRTDMAIIPSRGGEGLPRALLEAASCARPLVVTDVPGCRHFVRDGVEGFVVPPENPQALADAMARLATDRALREKMGRAARKRLLNGFTEDDIIATMRSIYHRLLPARLPQP